MGTGMVGNIHFDLDITTHILVNIKRDFKKYFTSSNAIYYCTFDFTISPNNLPTRSVVIGQSVNIE